MTYSYWVNVVLAILTVALAFTVYTVHCVYSGQNTLVCQLACWIHVLSAPPTLLSISPPSPSPPSSLTPNLFSEIKPDNSLVKGKRGKGKKEKKRAGPGDMPEKKKHNIDELQVCGYSTVGPSEQNWLILCYYNQNCNFKHFIPILPTGTCL